MVNNTTDRILFLSKKFNIFNVEELDKRVEKLEKEGYKIKFVDKTGISSVIDGDLKVIAIICYLEDKLYYGLPNQIIWVSNDIFLNMISVDPTFNKSYVQWMLNTFTRFIKDGNIIAAIRFVIEDLPQAGEYIKLFEGNKRKKKFSDLCKSSYILKNIKDPTDINQYKSLSQLFDAIDPFIIRHPSEVESLLMKYVNSGQAEIPVKDRKFTLYIPKTIHASTIFEKFANWCTAKEGNGMFANYRGHLTPFNTKSDLFIIINNDFFNGTSKELYQMHFETNQIKDRHNSQNVNIFSDVISESEGISNFFQEHLIKHAKALNTSLENNKYLNFLISFGFCETLFELLDETTPTIRFIASREIPRLPDLSKFKMLDQLIITDANLVELHSSIGDLENLEMLVLTQNKIKTIPKEIGKLKKLTFINLVGNEIVDFPEDIKYLDKSNGGSLFRLAVRKEEIGVENFIKLKKLLPSVII
jgi:Leucine-rich repeat (LRR) protein